MIIYLKGISVKCSSFNGNVKINNASLKFILKLSTQKGKFSLYKNQI